MPLNLKSLRTRFTLRFLRALNKINQANKTQPQELSSKTYKRVKVAADSSLALAVGPGRAWTRAVILRARPGSQRCRPRVLGRRRRCVRAETDRADELRRLVPGGEGLIDMKSLLDETLDYIVCLATQVNVMREIVDVCYNNNNNNNSS